MSQQNPWKILGISPTKDSSAIDQAWRRLASQHHPDRGGDATLFHQAREAYELAQKLSSSVIPITQVRAPIKVTVSLGRSTVLHDSELTVEWYDAKNQSHVCELSVPTWRWAWGEQRRFDVTDVATKTHLHFNLKLVDDELILFKDQLVWRPKVDLAPAIKCRSITARLSSYEYTVDVDDYGVGVLASQGYLYNEETRSDILVEPKYRWPKINDDQTKIQ